MFVKSYGGDPTMCLYEVKTNRFGSSITYCDWDVSYWRLTEIHVLDYVKMFRCSFFRNEL